MITVGGVSAANRTGGKRMKKEFSPERAAHFTLLGAALSELMWFVIYSAGSATAATGYSCLAVVPPTVPISYNRSLFRLSEVVKKANAFTLSCNHS